MRFHAEQTIQPGLKTSEPESRSRTPSFPVSLLPYPREIWTGSPNFTGPGEIWNIRSDEFQGFELDRGIHRSEDSIQPRFPRVWSFMMFDQTERIAFRNFRWWRNGFYFMVLLGEWLMSYCWWLWMILLGGWLVRDSYRRILYGWQLSDWGF